METNWPRLDYLRSTGRATLGLDLAFSCWIIAMVDVSYSSWFYFLIWYQSTLVVTSQQPLLRLTSEQFRGLVNDKTTHFPRAMPTSATSAAPFLLCRQFYDVAETDVARNALELPRYVTRWVHILDLFSSYLSILSITQRVTTRFQKSNILLVLCPSITQCHSYLWNEFDFTSNFRNNEQKQPKISTLHFATIRAKMLRTQVQ